jgi:hypothetical protein
MTPEERLKGSFLLFLIYAWTRVLRLPKPTRVQRDIAEYLESGPRKRFIAAFRGVGKTFLTGAYVVWRLWKDPDLKIMVVSANERFATKVASFVHTLINAEDAVTRQPVPWAELRARPGQKNSVLEFEVGPAAPSKDPSVFAVGITGQMTGGRADIILSDDVEAPNNSETEAQREKLEDRTGEYAAILKPDGETIYLGTFQSMQSVYRKLRDKGYGMRIWPARYPLVDKLHIYGDALAPLLKADIEANPELQKPLASTLGGAPTDPERFTDVDLMEREAEWLQAGFTLQFMLDTTLSDEGRYPLKTRDMIVMDIPRDVAPTRVAWGSSADLLYKADNLGFDGDRLYRPVYKSEEWLPFTGSLLSIDPSGTGADETAYAVTKFLNGQVYLRRWGGFRDGHSETTLAALAQIAKDEAVNLIRVEGNFGDGMFSRLLEPHLRRIAYSIRVEDFKVSTQKERRIIQTLRPVLQQHRLVVDTAVLEDDLSKVKAQGGLEYSGLYQLTHLTEARGSLRHDDRIDVLAGAVGYWTEHMSLDAQEAEKQREERAAKEFEKLLRSTSVTGRATRGRPRRAPGRRR